MSLVNPGSAPKCRFRSAEDRTSGAGMGESGPSAVYSSLENALIRAWMNKLGSGLLTRVWASGEKKRSALRLRFALLFSGCQEHRYHGRQEQRAAYILSANGLILRSVTD